MSQFHDVPSLPQTRFSASPSSSTPTPTRRRRTRRRRLPRRDGQAAAFDCVREAEAWLASDPKAHGYLAIDGVAAYDAAVKALVFGADSEAVTAGRVVIVQTLGGTGALKVGADPGR